MSESEVLQVLDSLERRGIRVWVDGGWGVDALVGQQTRKHSDLDLALDREELDRARTALEEHGFAHDPSVEPGLPARLVMRDGKAREVDLHPLAFDERGDGWQQLSESGMAWGCYPAEHLNATGVIRGREVACLSAELQLRFRMGYELTDSDEHDIGLLVERFDVPAPPPFR